MKCLLCRDDLDRRHMLCDDCLERVGFRSASTERGIPWLQEEVSSDLMVEAEQVVVPEEECRYLDDEHDIRIDCPIILEEVEDRALGDPSNDYGRALEDWWWRLYTKPKDEFIGEILSHGWTIRDSSLEGEDKGTAIAYAIMSNYWEVRTETGEWPGG